MSFVPKRNKVLRLMKLYDGINLENSRKVGNISIIKEYNRVFF